MSRNHGPIRFRSSDGQVIQVENPIWRAKVNKRKAANKVAKRSRKKNR